MKCGFKWFFALAIAASLSVRAQDTEGTHKAAKNATPPNARTAATNGSSDTAVIPDFFFNGGTVRELVVNLRENGRKAGLLPLNVIITAEGEAQGVPPLELHNVRYADIFQALNKLTGNGGINGKWELSMTGESSIWVLDPAIPQPLPQIDPLTGLPLGPGGRPPEPPKNCQIYQLQRYLTKYKVEDITTAIHTAWGMVGLEKGAELKYHKDTSLLIAVGSPAQLEIISRLLHSLEEGLALADNAKHVPAEVFLNGAVNRPGSIALSDDMDILTALARAGGLTARADERKIKFTRPGVMEKMLLFDDLKRNPKTNIVLKPGDIIEVGEKLF
jgi:hypothetical protein